jgi:hypothetical protein
MTAGQLVLSLATLSLATLSVALLLTIRSQSRTIERLSRSVDQLFDEVRLRGAPAPPTGAPQPATSLQPLPAPVQPSPASRPSVVTALLAVPLLKLAALSYGVRQALDAEHRRHLSRVVDQELRAARRRRRTARMGTRRTTAHSR